MPRILCKETTGLVILHVNQAAINTLLVNDIIYRESGADGSKDATYMPRTAIEEHCKADFTSVSAHIILYCGKENVVSLDLKPVDMSQDYEGVVHNFNRTKRPYELHPMPEQIDFRFGREEFKLMLDAMSAGMKTEWDRMRTEMHREDSPYYRDARDRYNRYEALYNKMMLHLEVLKP